MSEPASESAAAPSSKALREAAWKRLIDRCAAGDQAALASLYDESGPLVHALARRMLGDAADAEEVTMDVYAQAWRTAASYDESRGSATAWLVLMTRSRALDRLRSRAPRMQSEQPMPEMMEQQADQGSSPERETAAGERRRRILAALATLPPEQYEAVQLAFFAGMTHSELAERLGQPLGTVKARIRHGMMKLRGHLEMYATS